MSAPKFDLAILKDNLGPRAFARGEAYAEQGCVEIISIEGDELLAHVEGTEVYLVEMTISMNAGLCSCPAFQDFGICKHLAATAITYNDLPESEAAEARGRIARLRDGLALESKEALIERIVELAKQDPGVLARLES